MPACTPALLASLEHSIICMRLSAELLEKETPEDSFDLVGIKASGLFFNGGSCLTCTTVWNLGMRKQAIRCVGIKG